MKYHYMRISSTTVRIELIPEDNAEKLILQELAQDSTDDLGLTKLFENGLAIYQPQAKLITKTFMDFPRVALCNFQLVTNFSAIQSV
ncbi:hypothetical protein [Pedobacter xixiisoli]|nr:hypothetical protein [Pedobacter xixiisoli]